MGSMLDPHNPAAYTPMRIWWEVEGKKGCCWERLGLCRCQYDTTAAKRLRGNYKVVRVRAAASLGIDASDWRRIVSISERNCNGIRLV